MTTPHALISVSDKTDVVEFARAIAETGYAILSTGGTAKVLGDAGIACRQVSSYTDFPEIMDGRVKTLHPKIHGGLLARRDKENHCDAMAEHGIESIDLVVVNLYPFVETVLREGTTRAEAIEQIDIGGPSMIRAAAKNHDFVCVVCDPSDYAEVTRALKVGAVTQELRSHLAAKAYSITADYDAAVSCYLAGESSLPRITPASPVAAVEPAQAPESSLGEVFHVSGDRIRSLRYGENPHQEAAFYGFTGAAGATMAAAEFLGGNKELSYNNILDLDAAIGLAREFPPVMPACVIVKHGNPCGAAVSDGDLAAAWASAHECDPLSAFGSIVACNVEVDRVAAQQMAAPGKFIEAVIAPSFTADAIEALRGAKFGKNLRILATGDLSEYAPGLAIRSVSGGFLVQTEDLPRRELELEFVTQRRPSDEEIKDLRFAHVVCKHVRSNAIVIANEGRAVGVGAGQMSRVDSVEIAVRKARDNAVGGVLASDAFFPFPDGVEAAAAAGITAVIQPGGSRKDADVIAAANEHDVAMVLTGVRHFRH
ncbi:MAG: bifunctional phosphoribosylaminoimidazolecarboxamide formyltransferase/inosine monophosphate cyclohydrolase [Planctomycetes bacterium]|jgi:phosphoribosylaminoimidazolecarboxamide formyltransferase/IMP cyclohydrolase|nr:bifunctional phosphoribosylaminoimidazolecarboxamide formyltransferase/inosine monophosphate cyclohydrolase [Planctomycetota bacterium]MDP6424176.1 bifunctional phosphoribosylaminoimidazolecarboxamide formyltransferase/IMP cyclohydrolase [Planctomycetota bacterium]